VGSPITFVDVKTRASTSNHGQSYCTLNHSGSVSHASVHRLVKHPAQPSNQRWIRAVYARRAAIDRLPRVRGSDVASSYRLSRLGRVMETTRALSEAHYGFRRCRSTTDAISEVICIARDVSSGPVQNRDMCAVVTVDVKNAFHTTPWVLFDAELQRLGAPRCLIEILRSYMSDRSILLGREMMS